jgi:hypothetical protein
MEAVQALKRLWFLRLGLRSHLLLLLACSATLLMVDRIREIAAERAAAIDQARAGLLAAARRAAEQHDNLVSDTKAILELSAALAG